MLQESEIWQSNGRSTRKSERTIAQIADDLGVASNQLHQWASKYEREAVAKRNTTGETLEEENRRLRKENERLRTTSPW